MGGAASPGDEIDKFMQTPLLRDTPKTNDMPDEKEVKRVAELGMWIAWANVRDIDYWTTRINSVKCGYDPFARRPKQTEHLLDLRNLSPVVERLEALGATGLGTLAVKKKLVGGHTTEERVLDINALRTVGALLSVIPGSNIFLGKVAEVVKVPQKILPELATLPPKHDQTP